LETDPDCFGPHLGSPSCHARSVPFPVGFLISIGSDHTFSRRAYWHFCLFNLRIDIWQERRWKAFATGESFLRWNDSLLDVVIRLPPDDWISLRLLRYLVYFDAQVVRIAIAIFDFRSQIQQQKQDEQSIGPKCSIDAL
jgi:hypothetical protein